MMSSRMAARLLITATLGLCCSCEAGEKMEMSKAPAPVQTTAKRLIADNKFDGFEKEEHDGKPVYEVTYKVDGVDHSALITEAGEVVEEEVDVEMSKVPAAVLEAAKKAHADARIKETAWVTAGGKSYYELDLKLGKEKREMKVNADGSVISDKVEDEEKDEHKK